MKKTQQFLTSLKVAELPLILYLLILAITLACMYAGCIPKSLIPAMMVLMVLGEGLAFLGNTIPFVKTYLGGSVVCILGGALMALGAFMLLVEFLLVITFDHYSFVGWSLYPLTALMVLGGLLIYLAINHSARETMERKLFI